MNVEGWNDERPEARASEFRGRGLASSSESGAWMGGVNPGWEVRGGRLKGHGQPG